MTRVSISLGAQAVPAVRDAVRHAQVYPTHDPIVVFRAEPEQVVTWTCAGDAPGALPGDCIVEAP